MKVNYHHHSYTGPISIGDDKLMTFDPTKPVQTKDGRKAEYVGCVGLNEVYHLFKIEGEYEYSGKFSPYHKNGKNAMSESSNWDLINIPEPKPIDVKIGGVYRLINNDIGICLGIHKDCQNSYSLHFLGAPDSWTYVTKNGKAYWHDNNVIEYLGDIQDLNLYIKEKLK